MESHIQSFPLMIGYVSAESVVLRRWGCEFDRGKFLPPWRDHEFDVSSFRFLSEQINEGVTLVISLQWQCDTCLPLGWHVEK